MDEMLAHNLFAIANFLVTVLNKALVIKNSHRVAARQQCETYVTRVTLAETLTF